MKTAWAVFLMVLTSLVVTIGTVTVLLVSGGGEWRAGRSRDGFVLGPHASLRSQLEWPASWEPKASLQGIRSAPRPPFQGEDGDRGPAHLRALADSAARLCGVEPNLFAALIQRESGWREHAVSRSGALGLAQVKPETARELGLDARDTWEGLLSGACYLRIQFDRYRDWHLALQAYVQGPNRTHTTHATRRYSATIMKDSK